MSVENTKWYAIRCMSGKEKKVEKYLRKEIERSKYDRFVEEILIPLKKEKRSIGTRKVKMDRVFMPGYLFIKAYMFAELAQIIKSVPNVIGVVGSDKGKNPLPIPENEMKEILNRMKSGELEEVDSFNFMPGEKVFIKEGPFEKFEGTVKEVDSKNKRLQVSISLFGREVDIEIGFVQVEPLK